MDNATPNNKVKNAKFEDVKSSENQAEPTAKSAAELYAEWVEAQVAEGSKAEKVKKERKHPFREFVKTHPKVMEALQIAGLVVLGSAAAGAGAYGIYSAIGIVSGAGIRITQNATTKVLTNVATEGVKAIPTEFYCKTAIENLVKSDAAAKVAEQLPTIAGQII